MIVYQLCNLPKSFSLFALVAACALLQVGCSGGPEGPAVFPVEGTVNFAGAPVDDGRITFRMTEGTQMAYSTEIKGGQYKVEAEAGKATVEIIASRPVPGKFDTSNPDDEPQPVGEMYIPEKYNAKTTLTADIAASPENKIPFDLTE